MRSAWLLALPLFTAIFLPAAAQESKSNGVTPELEKTLSDVNQQWLCARTHFNWKAGWFKRN